MRFYRCRTLPWSSTLAALALAGTAHAHDSSSSYIEQIVGSRALIDQAGTGNAATIDQTSRAGYGYGGHHHGDGDHGGHGHGKKKDRHGSNSGHGSGNSGHGHGKTVVAAHGIDGEGDGHRASRPRTAYSEAASGAAFSITFLPR